MTSHGPLPELSLLSQGIDLDLTSEDTQSFQSCKLQTFLK